MFQIRVHGREEDEAKAEEKEEEEDKLFTHDASGEQGEDAPVQDANFMAGNPQVRVTTGKLRFYRPDNLPYAAGGGRRASQQLPLERNTLVCIVSVPAHMPPVEILEFLASFLADISLVRILKDPERGNCMALMQFTTQDRADQFFTVRSPRSYQVCWSDYDGELTRWIPPLTTTGTQRQVLQLDRARAVQDRVCAQH